MPILLPMPLRPQLLQPSEAHPACSRPMPARSRSASPGDRAQLRSCRWSARGDHHWFVDSSSSQMNSRLLATLRFRSHIKGRSVDVSRGRSGLMPDLPRFRPPETSRKLPRHRVDVPSRQSRVPWRTPSRCRIEKKNIQEPSAGPRSRDPRSRTARETWGRFGSSSRHRVDATRLHRQGPCRPLFLG